MRISDWSSDVCSSDLVSEIVDERVNQCFEFWLQSLHSLGIESLHQELAYARVSRWIDVDDIREESAAFPLEDRFHLVEMAIGHLLVVPEFLRKSNRISTYCLTIVMSQHEKISHRK